MSVDWDGILSALSILGVDNRLKNLGCVKQISEHEGEYLRKITWPIGAQNEPWVHKFLVRWPDGVKLIAGHP